VFDRTKTKTHHNFVKDTLFSEIGYTALRLIDIYGIYSRYREATYRARDGNSSYPQHGSKKGRNLKEFTESACRAWGYDIESEEFVD
jgi:hypothetical protein